MYVSAGNHGLFNAEIDPSPDGGHPSGSAVGHNFLEMLFESRKVGRGGTAQGSERPFVGRWPASEGSMDCNERGRQGGREKRRQGGKKQRFGAACAYLMAMTVHSFHALASHLPHACCAPLTGRAGPPARGGRA